MDEATKKRFYLWNELKEAKEKGISPPGGPELFAKLEAEFGETTIADVICEKVRDIVSDETPVYCDPEIVEQLPDDLEA